MSVQSISQVTGSQINILYNTHFISVTKKIPKATAALSNGVLKAGTIIAADGSSANTSVLGVNAIGIVLNDVDFTNVATGLSEQVPVLIHGFVDTAAITANVAAPVTEAKAALKQITFL